MRVGIRDARANLGSLLDQVVNGSQIEISRRGQIIAKIIPVTNPSKKKLPRLTDFRKKIISQGISLSQILIEEREKERN